MSKTPSTHIEQWLIIVAEKLRGASCTVTLNYEDRYQGNELALSIKAPNGFACLYVHRRAARKASIIFVAGSVETVTQISGILRDLHKSVSRFENAKRKFLHRIERLLSFLQESFLIREKEYPHEALGKLKKLFPDSLGMTGAEARFRETSHDQGAVELEGEEIDEKEQKKFPTFYAAKIIHDEKTYSALYHGETKKFYPKGALVIETLTLLEKKREKEDSYAIKMGVSPRIDPLVESNLQGGGSWSFSGGSSNSSNTSSNWCEIPNCGDVGGCDVPDCDLPDCSVPDIDCSGCDIGGCDIG